MVAKMLSISAQDLAVSSQVHAASSLLEFDEVATFMA